MQRRQSWSTKHTHSFPNDVGSMCCAAPLHFTIKLNLTPEALQIHKMTGTLLGQEKSAQNTATAKRHFHMFKNITPGCQIVFVRTEPLVQNYDRNQRLVLVFCKYLASPFMQFLIYLFIFLKNCNTVL